MKEEKKIENVVGDAMEKYRVSPPAEMREAIRAQLIEKNLLEKRRRNRMGFLWLSLVLVLGTSVYFMTKVYRKDMKSSQNVSAVKEKNALPDNTKSEGNASQKTLQQLSSEEKIRAENLNDNNDSDEKESTGTQSVFSSLPAEKNLALQKDVPAKEKSTFNKNQKNIEPLARAEPVTRSDDNKLSRNKNKASTKAIEENIASQKDTTAKTKSSFNAGNASVKPLARTQSSPGNKSVLNKSQTEIAATGKSKNIAAENQEKSNMAENGSATQKQDADATVNHDEVPTASEKPPPAAASESEQAKNESSDAAIHKTDSLIIKTDSVLAKDNLPDSVIKEKSKSPFKLSADLSAGPQFSTLQYEMNGDANSTYYESAKQSEKANSSITVNLGVNIQLRSFLFQTGIGSSSLKTDFSSTESSTEYDTSRSHYNYVDTTYFIFDSSCVCTTSVTYHIDSTWESQIDSSVKTFSQNGSNKISYIEIPFQIGYQFTAGRFDIELFAGTSIALLNQMNTTIISVVDGSIKTYRSKTNSPYRSSYWNFLGSAQVNYRLSKRFTVFLRPSVKYGLSSIFKSEYPLTEKVRRNSISAGFRVQF